MKTYKIWSDDLGYPEADAFTRTAKHDWWTIEDVIDDLLEAKYHEWENPSPFDMSVCEVDESGNKQGDVQTYFVEVDWSPNFYINPKT